MKACFSIASQAVSEGELSVRFTVEPEQARFLSKVKIKGRKEDACWEWTGTQASRPCRGKAGGPSGPYGFLSIGGKKLRAHRYSYELFNAPLSKGQVVSHSCDNTLCVNPHHLDAVSQSDNVKDIHRRGRARGKQKGGKIC